MGITWCECDRENTCVGTTAEKCGVGAEKNKILHATFASTLGFSSPNNINEITILYINIQ